MKIKVWLHVYMNNREALSDFEKFFSYEIKNEGVQSYILPEPSKALSSFTGALEKLKIKYEIFRREYSFTKKDKLEASLLKLIIYGNAKDAVYHEEPKFCSHCDSRLPEKHKKNVFINPSDLKKYDISSSYSGEDFISERLRKVIVDANINSVGFEEIFNIKTNDTVPNYYSLVLKEGIGDVVPPTINDKGIKCPTCGFYDKNLIKSPLVFNRDDWEGGDIFLTSDWFGQPTYRQSRDIIISNRFYKILLDNNIKGYSVAPCFFVDQNPKLSYLMK